MMPPSVSLSLATHPHERGWASKIEAGGIHLKPCLPHLWGRGHATPILASPCSQGEGDHEVVEGVAAEGGQCPRSGHKANC